MTATDEEVFKAATARTELRWSRVDEDTVRSLAKELQAPLHLVAEAYTRELARLEPNARVKTFLPLLVGHLVRRSGVRNQRSTDGLDS